MARRSAAGIAPYAAISAGLALGTAFSFSLSLSFACLAAFVFAVLALAAAALAPAAGDGCAAAGAAGAAAFFLALGVAADLGPAAAGGCLAAGAAAFFLAAGSAKVGTMTISDSKTRATRRMQVSRPEFGASYPERGSTGRCSPREPSVSMPDGKADP